MRSDKGSPPAQAPTGVGPLRARLANWVDCRTGGQMAGRRIGMTFPRLPQSPAKGQPRGPEESLSRSFGPCVMTRSRTLQAVHGVHGYLTADIPVSSPLTGRPRVARVVTKSSSTVCCLRLQYKKSSSSRTCSDFGSLSPPEALVLTYNLLLFHQSHFDAIVRKTPADSRVLPRIICHAQLIILIPPPYRTHLSLRAAASRTRQYQQQQQQHHFYEAAVVSLCASRKFLAHRELPGSACFVHWLCSLLSVLVCDLHCSAIGFNSRTGGWAELASLSLPAPPSVTSPYIQRGSQVSRLGQHPGRSYTSTSGKKRPQVRESARCRRLLRQSHILSVISRASLSRGGVRASEQPTNPLQPAATGERYLLVHPRSVISRRAEISSSGDSSLPPGIPVPGENRHAIPYLPRLQGSIPAYRLYLASDLVFAPCS